MIYQLENDKKRPSFKAIKLKVTYFNNKKDSGVKHKNKLMTRGGFQTVVVLAQHIPVDTTDC